MHRPSTRTVVPTSAGESSSSRTVRPTPLGITRTGGAGSITGFDAVDAGGFAGGRAAGADVGADAVAAALVDAEWVLPDESGVLVSGAAFAGGFTGTVSPAARASPPRPPQAAASVAVAARSPARMMPSLARAISGPPG